MEIKRKTRKYVKELNELKYRVERRKSQLHILLNISNAMSGSKNLDDVLKAAVNLQKPLVRINDGQTIVKKKPRKGDTQRISLQLFKKGNTLLEIAAQRQLAFSTIEVHLAGFVSTGEIDILDIVDEAKLEKILKTIEQHPSLTSSELKRRLGDDCSYGQVKAAMNFKSYRAETRL